MENYKSITNSQKLKDFGKFSLMKFAFFVYQQSRSLATLAVITRTKSRFRPDLKDVWLSFLSFLTGGADGIKSPLVRNVSFQRATGDYKIFNVLEEYRRKCKMMCAKTNRT
jgi:hypothetical protein